MQEELQQRADYLNNCAYHYYLLNTSLISDSEYDQLFKELQELEQQYPQDIASNSPTKRVGFPVQSKFEKYHHQVPMLSLNNSMNTIELTEFYNTCVANIGKNKEHINFISELKLDGLGLSLFYTDGVLTSAATRGDGLIGENVTLNAKSIPSIPLELKPFRSDIGIPHLMEVRGEVVMKRTDFRLLNEQCRKEGRSEYVTPRNAASGSLRQLDPSETRKRRLTFYAYHLAYTEGSYYTEQSTKLLSHQSGILWYLAKLGFLVETNYGMSSDLDSIITNINEIQQKRDNLDIDIDGVVIKVDSFEQQKTLGMLSRAPKWATAFKFPAKGEKTILKEVVYQTGRTGIISPVGIVEPVQVGGVTIERVTLHNEAYIRSLDLKIGDLIYIERSGDVIPKIRSVDTQTRSGQEQTIIFPHDCPICKGPVLKQLRHDEYNSGMYYCDNPNCSEKIVRRLEHFACRDAMNIVGLSGGIIQKFYDYRIVAQLSDLYELKESDFIVGNTTLTKKKLYLSGFGKSSVRKLLDAIEKSKETTLARFVYALGISTIGRQTTKDIESYCQTIDSFMNITKGELLSINGIGEIGANAIIDYRDRYRDEIEKLIQSGLIFIQETIVNNNISTIKNLYFTGKIGVITGIFDSISRKEIEEQLQQAGAIVASAMSKKTQFCVAGKKAGLKLIMAEKLGLRIFDETDFLATIKGQ